MNNWLSRYLQKYLLSFMGQNPTKIFNAHELAFSLFDSDKDSLNFVLKDEFNLLIDELNLLPEMKLSPQHKTLQDETYGEVLQDEWYLFDPVDEIQSETNLSKWRCLVENNLYYLLLYYVVIIWGCSC